MSEAVHSSGAIAIFVKTPGHSAVKTRLATAVGAEAAVEWHRRAAATVAAVACAATREHGTATRQHGPVTREHGAVTREHSPVVYWAVAEPAAIAARAWDDLPNLAQGDGGLGARMGRVHAELVRRHGHGVLLGADAPQVTTRMLADALAWCAAPAPRQAIGCACDGGFWLYAGNRTLAIERWEEVAYSRPDTGRAFRAAFAEAGDWLVLPTLTDVDEYADLAVVRRELAALSRPLPEQADLAAWLASTFADDEVSRRHGRAPS